MSTSNPPASVKLPAAGDMVAGKYVLDRLIGRGGMGAVFSAKHVKLSKAVAIKIMLAERNNPEALTRFINEGRAAANIQNEHVVRVDDVDEERGYAYMVLELLDGEDLSQIVEREAARRLAPHLTVSYVLQALRGVAQAHALGIVHRDLKPSNLFLAKRPDGTTVVKVLDFGISKQQSASGLNATPGALTSTKAMLGSPLYMSPEQLRSSKTVDHRADIWAFGVILYELLTGTLPFMGETLGELFAAILETEPAPLRTRVDGIHPGLEQVVLRCLQRRPENRYASAHELAQALAPFVDTTSPTSANQLAAAAPLSAPGFGAPFAGAAGTAPVPGYMTPPGGGFGGTPSPYGAGAYSAGGPGSNPAPRSASTVALGAATPPGMQQSVTGWQRTGGGAAGVPRGPSPVLVGGIVAGVLLLGGVVGALALRPGKKTDSVSATRVAAATTAQPSATAEPPAPSASAALVAPAASSVASASPPDPAPSASPAKPVLPAAQAGLRPVARPSGTRDAVKPSSDPVKPPVDPAKPTTKPTNNGALQNAR